MERSELGKPTKGRDVKDWSRLELYLIKGCRYERVSTCFTQPRCARIFLFRSIRNGRKVL